MIKTANVEQLAPASRKLVVCICDTCKTGYLEAYRNITRSKFADKYCKKCRSLARSHHLSELKRIFYKSIEGKKVKQHLSQITRQQSKNRQGAFSTENRRKQADSLSKLHRKIAGPYAKHIFKITKGSNHPRWRQDKDEYETYRAKVYTETQKWDLTILKQSGKRGLCGIPSATQLDHKLSIYYGYTHNVEPEIVGHVCNLEFINWKENRTKGRKCSISLNQLLKNIKKYNEKSLMTIFWE